MHLPDIAKETRGRTNRRKVASHECQRVTIAGDHAATKQNDVEFLQDVGSMDGVVVPVHKSLKG